MIYAPVATFIVKVMRPADLFVCIETNKLIEYTLFASVLPSVRF